MSKTSSSQSANALRILALDSIKEANSGHSGMPMGMADIAEVLWQRHLRHNPEIQIGSIEIDSSCRMVMALC
jgi:transketolase